MDILFKLNFEKTAIFVLVLILLISTANIYTQFFSLVSPDKEVNVTQPGGITGLSFPVMLLKADQLYKQGNYKEAQDEYLLLTKLNPLSLQQKSTAYFRLGLCTYKLGKYDLAGSSFIEAATYNPRDAAAFNNAAVSAYLANNTGKAEQYMKKAIGISPSVEYYYNLGRIYEKAKKYEDAAKYYIAAVRGGENITRDYAIDPVLLSVKVNSLIPDKAERDKLAKDLFIALKLKESREVYIIEDGGMNLEADFSTRIANVNGSNRLYCKYDRKTMDPYNLIDSLSWVVKRKGEVVYTGTKDEFSVKVQEEDDYDVLLSLKYNDKIKEKNKIISKKQIMDVAAKNRNHQDNAANQTCKYYVYAAYEQVFENDFKLGSKGFTDRFGVAWGKDGITTEVMKQDFIDAGSSLDVINDLNRNAGIWADLSTLLDDKDLRGKTITVKFYARKITSNANMTARLRVKADQIYYAYDTYPLAYKWRQYSMDIFIPKDSTNMTFSLQINPGEEVKIDGFIISAVR
ncbi:MAG: tetratricopeptide repeat protein [Caulobacteraceae bacterium]